MPLRESESKQSLRNACGLEGRAAPLGTRPTMNLRRVLPSRTGWTAHQPTRLIIQMYKAAATDSYALLPAYAEPPCLDTSMPAISISSETRSMPANLSPKNMRSDQKATHPTW